MKSTITARLETLLRRIQLAISDSASPSLSSDQQDLFASICKLVFDEQAYQWLWDEPILSQLERLFQAEPPEPTLFGEQVAELHQRTQQVQRVNDLFFAILNSDSSVEEVKNALVALTQTDFSLVCHLKSSDRLADIRKTDGLPSEKVASFLDFLQEEVDLDLLNQESVKGCLEALKAREWPGKVNALLVKPGGEGALVIPLQVIIQPGTGQVRNVVHDREDFKKALERARLALVGHRFLRESDDVICTLTVTEPQYTGNSIGLAAAVSMHCAASGKVIDSYTAFTGDINLEGGHWRIRGVSGLSQKLKAAWLSGCRRIFIPRENLQDMDSVEQGEMKIIPVEDLLEVLTHLQAPLRPMSRDSLQSRKIKALEAFCVNRGWAISSPRPIQNGVQSCVAPPFLSELLINIYNTGTHTPKQHDHHEYQELLAALQDQEESQIPIRKVEQRFNIQDPSLRAKIREALAQIQPAEQRQEPYCEYSFRFDQGQEHLMVKQYQKGTLQIQGAAGKLHKTILEYIIPRYNLHYPNAQLSVEALLKTEEVTDPVTTPPSVPSHGIQAIPLPHIGTDESGKGDYFGPMVVAAVLVDAVTKPQLEALGVKDSKLLSDKRCRELAAQIREICRGKHEEVEILPERYNELYENFQKEGQNLNHLLAWGHARTIESLLKRFPCNHAVADQFGNEHYLRSRLMEKGKHLHLTQVPKGERYLAVAAASILSRDRFLTRLEKLSEECGLELPKGASELVVTTAKKIVARQGSEELRKIAKLHHQTTRKILEKE